MVAYRRNILVGITVVGAVLIFGWMILEFSTKTAGLFGPAQIPLHFVASQASGLSAGSEVQYLGVDVGRVTALARNSDNMSVTIDAMVDVKPPLPANIRAEIVSPSALGGAAIISLNVDGEIAHGEITPNETIKANYIGLNLFPASLSQTADEIGAMSEEIRATMKELRESGSIMDLDKTIKNVNIQVARVGDVFGSLQNVLGNPQTREDLKVAISNIRSATDKLNALADGIQRTTVAATSAFKDAQLHIDNLSRQVGDRLTEVSNALISINNITRKIVNGQGTAGELVNDPKLYQALVDTSRQLDATVADLKRLVEQWEQEGVSMHLN